MPGLKLSAAPEAASALHETFPSTVMGFTSLGFSLSSKHNCAHFPKSLLADWSKDQRKGNETTAVEPLSPPPVLHQACPGTRSAYPGTQQPGLGRRTGNSLGRFLQPWECFLLWFRFIDRPHSYDLFF